MLVGFASAISGVGGFCCPWRPWCRWSGSGCLCAGSLSGSGGSGCVIISGSGGSDSVVGPSSDSLFGSGGSDSVMVPIPSLVPAISVPVPAVPAV